MSRNVMPAKFFPLADYNAEVARGIMHTPPTVWKMERLQAEFDEWQRTDEPEQPRTAEELRAEGHEVQSMHEFVHGLPGGSTEPELTEKRADTLEDEFLAETSKPIEGWARPKFTWAKIEEALNRQEREREEFVGRLRERLENFDQESTRSDRGFTHMNPVPSAYGGEISTYESSAAEHPHIWVKIECPVDLNKSDGPMKEAVAHLPIEGAALLARQINHLIKHHYSGGDDAASGEGGVHDPPSDSA